MIEIICNIVLILLFGITFFQDWKDRAVTWIVFPAILIAAIGVSLYSDSSVLTIAMNITFLIMVLGMLILYISIKRGKLTNIFKTDFGWGDVLFLVVITPLFRDQNYILFFITGMFFSGLIHLVVARLNGNPKIPLAGYLALYLIGLKLVDFFMEKDLFNSLIL